MKKWISISCIIWIAGTLSAQDMVSSFLTKYNENEDIQVTTISKKMLNLLTSIAQYDQSGIAQSLEGLDNIRALSSTDTAKCNEYYDCAYDLVNKAKGFEVLMASEGSDNNMILVAKESKGIIRELVLVSGQELSGTFNLISLTGKINLDTLAKYADQLNISGLDQVKKLQRHE